MNNKYIVVEDYTSQYKTPIRLCPGETVSVGKKYEDNPDWHGWIWCEKLSGEKGWVLERVLDIKYDRGVVLENYDAAELTVKKGELVEVIECEAGWAWCADQDKNRGWLPEKNIKQLIRE